MKTKQKKSDQKYNEFLKDLRKRMKELQKEEEKFREAVVKKNKINQHARV